MTLTPMEGYLKVRSRPAHFGEATTVLRLVTEDGELNDARLTAAERGCVKRLLRQVEKYLSSEALMFLAGGAEDAAWRKRDAEEARGR